MPVIVVGADTELGQTVAAALTGRQGEVRAFVSDPAAADPLRELGIKVAVGDVSDASHIEAAAHDAFCAVLIAGAASDGRERSFAASPEEVVARWHEGLGAAGVKRIIWIGPGPMSGLGSGTESATIDPDEMSPAEVATEAARLDDLAVLDPP